VERIEFDALDPTTIREILRENAGPVNAIPTGFPKWNRSCEEDGGLRGIAMGWYVLLGGATGYGKTALAINVAKSAVEDGRSVGFINFEMSRKQLTSRYAAILSGVPRRQIEPGKEFDWAAVEQAADFAGQGTGMMYMNREPIGNYDQLLACLRALREEVGCELFVVDYVQLIGHSTLGGYDKDQLISNTMRQFTHKHEVVTLALSQVGTEAIRAGGSPGLASAVGGVKWVQDADQGLLIDHTAHRQDEEAGDPMTGFGKVIIVKNRHGPLGAFDIRWDWRTMRCSELAKGVDIETPVDPTVDAYFKSLQEEFTEEPLPF
jgi:replicative DNA helicase